MGHSHQRGWVVARGKKWYGYFRRTVMDIASNEINTTVVPVALGARSQITPSKAILWWTWSGSNRRPLPCHGSALPAAPQAHKERTTLLLS